MATSEETLAEELPGEDRTVLFASVLAVAVVVGIAFRRQIRRFVEIWQDLAARDADMDEVFRAYSPAWLALMVLGNGPLARDRIV